MFIQVVNYIAIANFLIFICLLFFKKLRTRTNKVLSFLLTNVILTLVLNLFMYYKILSEFPVVLIMAYLVEFLWAPSLYYYIDVLLLGNKKCFYKRLWKFSLFIVVVLFFSWLLFQPYSYLRGFAVDMQENNIPWQFVTLNYLSVFQFLFFMFISNYKVITHNRELVSQGNNPDLLWLEKIIKTVSVLCILMYIPITFSASLLLYVILIPVVSIFLFTYLILKAITSPVLLADTRLLDDLGVSEKERKDVDNKIKTVIKRDSRLESINSNLEEILRENFVEKKLYLKHDINIQYVADICDMHVKTISLFINEKYNRNFAEYVNFYRISEAKQLLKEPEYQKYSFDVIADSVGFSSRSTFYNAFKKFNNSTPKQYVDSLAFD